MNQKQKKVLGTILPAIFNPGIFLDKFKNGYFKLGV